MLSSDKPFGEEASDFVKNYFRPNRRWQITLFRNEPAEGGGVKNILLEQFDNVRSKWATGTVVDHQGVLQFVAEDGREFVVSSMPFIAKEVAPAKE
jgi:hypothetical protein